MNQKKTRSAVPLYVVAALWLGRALMGNLSSFGDIFKTIALSVVVYFGVKLFFPDKAASQKDAEAAETQPEQQPEPAKPQPQPEPKPDEPKKPESTGNAELDAVLRRGEDAIRQIRLRNDEIPDYKISAQLKQIELLTEKIFDYVREHPEQLGEIRQFLNYYLPTTLSLLEKYVELQNQQLRVGNIDEGMRQIEDLLDKVAVAFQRQLDSLFESSVVDITADIQVMENMMAAEGLSGGRDFDTK